MIKRLLLLLGVLTAISLGFVSVARAETAPTFTLQGDTITASGGYLSEPTGIGEIIGNVVFNRVAGTSFYVTNLNGQKILHDNLFSTENSPDGCLLAIQLSPGSTSGSFVGVGKNSPAQINSACDDRVKRAVADVGRTIPSIVTATSNPEEEFFGENIPTCTMTPGTAAYNSCTIARTAAIKRAVDKIRCTTTDQASIDRCNSYLATAACLKSDVAISVSHCRASADAQSINNGDLSAISANTTDQDIQDICKTASSESLRNECIKKATAERDRLLGEESGEENTCAVESVGWAICPLMNFIAGLNDRAFSVLSGNFLETESELLDNDQTKAAWENFRNIANGLFVIAFMAIIYAQMVGGRN